MNSKQPFGTRDFAGGGWRQKESSTQSQHRTNYSPLIAEGIIGNDALKSVVASGVPRKQENKPPDYRFVMAINRINDPQKTNIISKLNKLCSEINDLQDLDELPHYTDRRDVDKELHRYQQFIFDFDSVIHEAIIAYEDACEAYNDATRNIDEEWLL